MIPGPKGSSRSILGGATLEEVGDVIGVTRERVRQIEVKALRKLRRIGAFHTYQFGEWWE